MGKKEKKVGGGKRKFSDSERREIIRRFKAHVGPKEAFFRAQGVTCSGVYRWMKEGREKKTLPSKRGRQKDDGPVLSKNKHSPESRRQAVEAYLKSGTSYKEFAKVWGVSSNSLSKWCKIYEERGAQGLESGIYGEGKKRGRKGSPPHLKAQIVLVQKENPSFGLKKVRDFLYRFRGVKVSTGTVRKTVKEANLPRAPLPPKKRRRSSDKIRRFERAKAMQLWQSDITSFVLTRHSQRVYLTVFMDDHSRYIVAWSLQLRQKSDLVMDSLLLGIQRFGKPQEVLTDQGRQYFSWRGKSDFQKLLDKEGIRHVVARSHHPQTLGKCERFWETIGQEFWERVKPQELEDTRERLAHFIAHYNHFRPHQGIGGMTPADRFFGLAVEIRKAIEETLTQNELRLAVGEAPRSPVFLIGQIGDQPVSLHGESGSLVVQTAQGELQRLGYSNFGHASQPTPAQLKGTENASNDAAVTEPASTERKHEPEGDSSKNPQTRIVSAQAAADCNPLALGVGNPCPEGASPPDRLSVDRVLAGSIEQARDCNAPECATASSLATLPASNLGYGGRTTDPTQSPSEGSCDGDSTRGRSEETATQDPGARETHYDPKSPDRDPSRDAGLSRCEAAIGEGSSISGERGGDEALRSEECKTSQEGPSTQEESGSIDDDTRGRRP
jgi:transposase InsO family protein